MPVVVTGASGFIGRHAIPRFLRSSPEVRAYVRRRESAPPLRELGAKVAVGRIDDVDNLVAVMRGAHTVCHLAGTMFVADEAQQEANVDSLRSVLSAAVRADVTRLLFVSYPGASSASRNAYLRAKGLAEEEISTSGLEHLILRATHVSGRGSPWLGTVRRLSRRWPCLVVGSGRQRMAPVSVHDVVSVLASADDRRMALSATLGLEGPDIVTGDGLADVLAGRRRPKVHLPPPAAAVALGMTGHPVPATALELMAADSRRDVADAAEEFALQQTSVVEGLGAGAA